MSDVKPTAGPWYAHHDREAGPGWDYFITAEPLGHMANEIAREVSSEANARLIAAAPDLLASLKLAMTWISNWDPNFTQDADWPEASDQIRAAISRAEGGRS